MSDQSFGALLRKHRIEAGLSQEQLAKRALISVDAVGSLERGVRRAPYGGTLAALAAALELPDAARAELEAAANRARARSVTRAAATSEHGAHLPFQLTSFVGREDEIAAVIGLLGDSRLVTVTGPGGVGKTRLVLEVAARLPDAQRDVVRFVDLAPLVSGDFIAGSIATALGTGSRGRADALESLVDGVGSRRFLIVLDNCEHLIADVAMVVTSILKACPEVTFLATSRERLAISGERIFRLRSLPVPDLAPSGIDDARTYAAPALLIDRVTSLDPSFEFADAQAALVARVCRRLDGIPLAIELVSAYVPALGLRALDERLESGLAHTAAARALPARQQTMQATIAWSYDLLSAPERTLFERLSVFAGSFTLEAMEAVCCEEGAAPGSTVDVLIALVDRSLVNVVMTDQHVRYTLLDSVRAFARARLAEHEPPAALPRRHARWLASLADGVEASSPQKTFHQVRLELEPERDNVRAALTWLLASRESADALLAGRIIGGMRMLWHEDERYGEIRMWAQGALERIDEEQFPSIVAGLLQAVIHTHHGPAVLPWLERAIPLVERIGDRRRLAALHRSAALHHLLNWRLGEADASASRAEKILNDEGLARLTPYAVLLSVRVWIYVGQKRFDEALADCATAESIERSHGNPHLLNWRTTRGYIAYAMGDIAMAVRQTEELLELVPSTPWAGETDILAPAGCNLALFRLTAGDVAGARQAGREVLSRVREHTGYWPYSVVALLAGVAAVRGDACTAARLIGFVRAWHERQDHPPTFAPRATIDLAVDAIRRQLPAPVIESLSEEGARLTLEAALAEASAI